MSWNPFTILRPPTSSLPVGGPERERECSSKSSCQYYKCRLQRRFWTEEAGTSGDFKRWSVIPWSKERRQRRIHLDKESLKTDIQTRSVKNGEWNVGSKNSNYYMNRHPFTNVSGCFFFTERKISLECFFQSESFWRCLATCTATLAVS